MKNENTSFANISIPFLRSCSQCNLVLNKIRAYLKDITNNLKKHEKFN